MKMYKYVGNENEAEVERAAGFRRGELVRRVHFSGEVVTELVADEDEREECIGGLIDLPEGAAMFVQQTLKEGMLWFAKSVADDNLRNDYSSCKKIFLFLYDNKDNKNLSLFLRNSILSLLDKYACDYVSSMTQEWIRSELFIECKEDEETEEIEF